jgi:hypothetical protein
MRKFHSKFADPVEVLENVVLPFANYEDEVHEDRRPLVTIYRYRFDNDFGIELFFQDKLSSSHFRFVSYKKDSIEKFGPQVWIQRSITRDIIKICKSESENYKNIVEKLKRTLTLYKVEHA